MGQLRFVMYSSRATGIQFFQKVSYIPRFLIPSLTIQTSAPILHFMAPQTRP